MILVRWFGRCFFVCKEFVVLVRDEVELGINLVVIVINDFEGVFVIIMYVMLFCGNVLIRYEYLFI